MPKPVLTLLDLSFPLASSDLGAETLENEFILRNMHLSQVSLILPENVATVPLIKEAIGLVSCSAIKQLSLFGFNVLQIQQKIEEMAAAGLDTTSLDDEAFNIETALDRCILRLIASCCNGELLEFPNYIIRMQLENILTRAASGAYSRR